MTPRNLRSSHKDYKDPDCVVYCKPGDPGGYPYANRRYRAVADAFVSQLGDRTIKDWSDSGYFTLDNGERFQVVSDRKCIDVVRAFELKPVEPTARELKLKQIMAEATAKVAAERT